MIPSSIPTSVIAHDLRFDLFISEAEIAARIAILAQTINQDYANQHPIFIGVLNGGFIFTADLVRACDLACEVHFVKLSSYEGMNSTGTIKTSLGLDVNIENRPIIIVEDIVDTGNTMHHFIANLKKEKPASIAIATLLLKPEALQHELQLDYVGFEIANKFVIGYGLDYDELGRNLKSIYQLETSEK